MLRHHHRVPVWGIYSDIHSEVDLAGDTDGLLQFAELLADGRADDLRLGDAPTDWLEGTHPLQAVRLEPTSDPANRIRLKRDGAVLRIAGHHGELARILAGPIRELAKEEPSPETRLWRHVHFDPTSDPEKRWYAPDSISIVVSRKPRT
jgi:hypothetical protein